MASVCGARLYPMLAIGQDINADFANLVTEGTGRMHRAAHAQTTTPEDVRPIE